MARNNAQPPQCAAAARTGRGTHDLLYSSGRPARPLVCPHAESDSAAPTAPQTAATAPAATDEPDLAAHEALAWPDLAEAVPEATEPPAQESPEQPKQEPTPLPHDIATPETGSNTLKTLTDRVGEATLTPVNSASAAANDAADFDVPAPAGKGAWDAYSLHDEWVGEPMTPYFLPSHGLVSALRSAGQRGVDVRIVLPAKNNLFYVHWAQFRLLPTLLEAGVRVWYQQPPFAHTKLLAVDGYYAQIGSANLDARSLRLNFELNMEVFDPDFHGNIASHIDRAVASGREITADALAALSLPVKLRNAACWIFSPYL